MKCQLKGFKVTKWKWGDKGNILHNLNYQEKLNAT